MKKVVDDIRLMTKISDMYYNQGINKQDIAKQLQISQIGRASCRERV